MNDNTYDFSDASNPFADAVNPFASETPAAELEPSKPTTTKDLLGSARDHLAKADEVPDYNMARGAVERGGQLLAGVFRAGDALSKGLEEALPMGGLVWEDGILPRYYSPEDYKAKMAQDNIREPLDIAADHWKESDAGYVPNHTWEKVKDEFSDDPLSGSAWGEVAMYAAEQGIKSVPDMAAAVLNLPAYIVSRSGEMGEARAENKGKDVTELEDVLEAMPFAVASAALERVGAKGITDAAKEQLGKEMLQAGFSNAAKRIAHTGGKAGGKEALTEFIQEGMLEYAGERLGTDAQMTLAESFDQGLAGAVAGGVYGGASGSATALPREYTLHRQHQAEKAAAEEAKANAEAEALGEELGEFSEANNPWNNAPARLPGTVTEVTAEDFEPPVDPTMTVSPTGEVDTEGKVSGGQPMKPPEETTRYQWFEQKNNVGEKQTVLVDTQTGEIMGHHGERLHVDADQQSKDFDTKIKRMIDTTAAERDAVIPDQMPLREEPFAPPSSSKKPSVDEIAAAAAETNTAPSEAQIEADNYKKGRTRINGFEIAFENPKGSVRSGVDEQGNKWESTMAHHYGDIKGHKGADGDDLDVFIGDNPESEKVYVIDQVTPETGKFDEHKIMMGFNSLEEARAGYLANYEENWQGLGEISELHENDFKSWVKGGKTDKPYALKPTGKKQAGTGVNTGVLDTKPTVEEAGKPTGATEAEIRVSASGKPFASDKAAKASIRANLRNSKLKGEFENYEVVPVTGGFGYREVRQAEQQEKGAQAVEEEEQSEQKATRFSDAFEAQDTFRKLKSEVALSDDQRRSVSEYNTAEGKGAFTLTDEQAKNMVDAAKANPTKEKVVLYRSGHFDEDLAERAGQTEGRTLIPLSTDEQWASSFGDNWGDHTVAKLTLEKGVPLLPIAEGNTNEAEALLYGPGVEVEKVAERLLNEDESSSLYKTENLVRQIEYVVRPKKQAKQPQQVEREATKPESAMEKHGVTVTVPSIDQKLVDDYNRVTHMGQGRDVNAELQASEALENGTAPEHVQGVSDRELDEIVKEFNDAQAEMMQGDHPVSNVFQPPKKNDVVRLNNKAKVYHKEHGWMTPEEARQRIDEWRSHAEQQGKNADSRSQNGDKVVLSLFDLSGKWSQPWEEAGYQVYRFDIQSDPDVGDVNKFSVEHFGDWFGDFEGLDIYAILAACPCTDFASSGARHFAAKDADGRTVASVELVHQTLRTIEYFKPAIWAVENPVGRIEKLGGLPPWRLSFDPNHLGDTYTKKTLIWGRFNGDLPVAPVEPTEGSKMHTQYGGKSQKTKNARSVTPEGFAYGFFMANNAYDHPTMAMANKYDRLDRDLIQQAFDAGVTDKQISYAVDDHYYMDLDDDAANDAIRDLIAEQQKETRAGSNGSNDKNSKVEDVTVFSTGKSGSGVPVDKVKQRIAKKVLSWDKGPIVEVVESVEQLPDHIQQQIKSRKVKSPHGLRDGYDGTVYIVAGNLRDLSHADRILAHEAVGHYAMEQMLGEEFDGVLNKVQYLKETDSRIKKIAAQVEGEGNPYIESAEIVAKLAEQDIKHPTLIKAYAAVRKFLKKLGFNIEFGLPELKAMLVDAAEYLRTGKRSVQVDPETDTGYEPAAAAFSQDVKPDGDLADVDKNQLLKLMQAKAESMSDADIHSEEVKASLEKGEFDTPLGKVYLGKNQIDKLLTKGRLKEAALVEPTLTNPQLVVSEPSGNTESERQETYLFIKSFQNKESGRFVEFVSVTVQQDGKEVMVSAHRKRAKQVERIIATGKLLYMPPDLKDELSGQSSQEQPTLATSSAKSVSDQSVDSKKKGKGVKDIPLFSQSKEGKVLEDLQLYGEEIAEKVTELWKKNWTADLRPAWLGALTRRHLADIAGKTLPQIKRYVRIAQEMDARRNELLTEGADLADRWTKYNLTNRKEAQALAELMHDATVAGVDPSKKHNVLITKADVEALREKNAKLIKERSHDGAGGGKSGIRSQTHLRKEVEDAEMKLAQERNRAKARPGLERRWNALSPEAQAIFIEVRDAYKKRQEMTLEAVEARIGRSVTDGQQAKQLMTSLRAEYESVTVEEPYFPLARFGKYWVDARKDDDRVFEMFETTAEQERYIEKMRAEGYRIRHGAKLDDLKQLDGVSAKFVTEVETMLSEQLGDWPKVEAIKDDIYQMYLQSLPDLSVRKHFIHRKKVKGYAKDALRAYADSMFHGSYQLSRLEYADQLLAELEEMREGLDADLDKVNAELKLARAAEGMIGLNIDSLRSMNTELTRKLRDTEDAELEQRLAAVKLALKHKEKPEKLDAEIAKLERTRQAALNIGNDRVKAAHLYNEMLKRHEWAMNPKGAAWANTASSIGFTWYLGVSPAAALVNVTQTPMVAYPMLAARFGWKESADALMNASNNYFAGGFGVESKLTGDRLKAYREAVRSGVVDKTLAHDLASVSQEGATYNPVRHKVMSGISFLFHNAERYNREVTYMAAYDLARDNGYRHEKAIEFAHEFTWDSHFDYSSGNKARFMQGDVAKVILMFRQFSLNMTYLLARNAQQSFKGMTKAERSLARRQLGGILGMHFLFAGAMGMPLWGVLGGALNAVFDDEDEPWDFDTEFRNFLADNFGKEIGHAIAHGPVQAITGQGVSSRVSLDGLWLRESRKELEGRDQVQYWFEQLLGPMGGIAMSTLGTAPELLKEGHNWRALEAAVPKFAKDGLKAIRYWDEGVNTLRGDSLVEELAWDKLIAQATGLTPAVIQERYEANNAIKKAEQRVKDRRQHLMNLFALAYRTQDTEGLREVKRAIVRFNEKNPNIGIMPYQLVGSIRRRERYSHDQIRGIVVDRKLRYLTENGRFAE